MIKTLRDRPYLLLAPLALLGLLAALWAGLLRMGWRLPTPAPALAALHGPLMVVGFFGVVIGLERAVALGRRWAYLAPAAAGLGALLALAGAPRGAGPLLAVLGSLVLLATYGAVARRHPAPHVAVMALGALCGLAGNLLWLAGRPFFTASLWWAGFLVLTVAGERLELGRLRGLPRRAYLSFALAVALLLAGTGYATFDFHMGARLAGAGLLALALWLLHYDIARRTVRKAGLTRFIAVCLLSGYVWLAAAGIIGLIYGGVPAGPLYDALLHAVFVGFIFAMIFGHAPIIIPAVLGPAVIFRRSFYLHLGLLHLALLLRLAGNLAGLAAVRQWGGMLNVAAILLFLAITAAAARRAPPMGTTRAPASRIAG